jgi:hypothetical protein
LDFCQRLQPGPARTELGVDGRSRTTRSHTRKGKRDIVGSESFPSARCCTTPDGRSTRTHNSRRRLRRKCCVYAVRPRTLYHPHMPIVDVEIVSVAAESAPQPSVAVLASALGRVFGSPPGRTWVRLRALPVSCYAENDAPLSPEALPVFVTVLQANPPQGTDLQAQVVAVTQAVAAWLAVSQERVHVCYSPPAAGRQAFGGKLV